jgi:hypothetical protein
LAAFGARVVHMGPASSCFWIRARNERLVDSICVSVFVGVYRRWSVSIHTPHPQVILWTDARVTTARDSSLDSPSEATFDALEADCYWCLTKLLDGIQVDDRYTVALILHQSYAHTNAGSLYIRTTWNSTNGPQT